MFYVQIRDENGILVKLKDDNIGLAIIKAIFILNFKYGYKVAELIFDKDNKRKMKNMRVCYED